MRNFRIVSAMLLCAVLATTNIERAAPAAMPDASSDPTLAALAPKLERLAAHMPGIVAISVADLSGGHVIAINGDVNLPAASTIKVPVMVEVFRQIAQGRFTQSTTIALTDGDRDCGYGSLCDAPWGTRYSVGTLLRLMIERSDNTAANMLIRKVGRQNVNATMTGLGLVQTRLGDSIRSDGDIRELRTSTNEMMDLLVMIARHEVVNDSACDAMIAILIGQRHNTLLPEYLPKGLAIAHKTGTLHDTLNDVGIVYLDGAPYVFCAFTTHLADLDDGERFIRTASKLTYQAFASEAAVGRR
jgi:beta-lactamase class A